MNRPLSFRQTPDLENFLRGWKVRLQEHLDRPATATHRGSRVHPPRRCAVEPADFISDLVRELDRAGFNTLTQAQREALLVLRRGCEAADYLDQWDNPPEETERLQPSQRSRVARPNATLLNWGPLC